jgi:hypothetical protein
VTPQQRWEIAEYLIRCADTVTLLTCAEVSDIHQRAQAGELDDVQVPSRKPIYESS